MPQESKARDQQIESVVDSFLEDLQSGRAPDAEAVAAEYPNLAPELVQRLRFAASLVEVFDESSSRRESTSAGVSTVLTCTHCGNRIRVVDDSPQLVCTSCGSGIEVSPDGGSSVENTDVFLNRFNLVREIGRGAFGVVYQAFDTTLRRTVAVKVPRAGTFNTKSEKLRFIREAQHAARLQHANIVQVYDTGTADSPFIVTEFVDGLTLDDLVGGPGISFTETAKLVAQIADALEYAHTKGIIHRDVKPSNILVDDEKRPHLTDFGLARGMEPAMTMTRDGEIIGTPAYMSPEQASAEHDKVGRRSDIYSAGVVLYQMLTSELPFQGSRRMLLNQVINDEPVAPRKIVESVPRDLETIVLKAMAKEQSARYQTAKELRDELRRWLVGDPIRARPPRFPERVWKLCRKYPVVSSLSILISVLLVALAVVSVILAVRESRARELAEANSRAQMANHSATLMQQGISSISHRGVFGSLPYAVEALATREMLGDVEANTLDRIRIDQTLRHFPYLVYLKAFGDRIDALQVDPVRKNLFVASGSTISVVSTVDWQVQSELQGDTRTVRIAVSGTGERLVALPHGDGNTAVTGTDMVSGEVVQLWDVVDATRIARLTHNAHVMDAVFSPDGMLIVTCALDGTTKVWSADSGEFIRTLSHDRELVMRTEFSPNGTTLVVHAQVRGKLNSSALHIWDTSTWNKVDAELGSYVNAFSVHDSKILTASADGVVREFDLATGRATALSLEHSVPCSKADYVGDRYILTHAADGSTSLWDTISRKRVYGPLPHGDQDKRLFEISRDGSFFAAPGAGDLVDVFWTLSGVPICPPLTHGAETSALAECEDNRRIVTGGVNGIVKVWDLAGTTRRANLLMGVGAKALPRFSSNGRRLVFTSDGQPGLWEADSGAPIVSPIPLDARAMEVQFDADGILLVTADENGKVKVWDSETGDLKDELPVEDEMVSCIEMSPAEAGTLIAGYDDGNVRKWNLRNFQSASICQFADRVVTLEIDCTGQFVLAGAENGNSRVVHLAEAKTSRLLSHRAPVQSAEFSPDASLVVTTCRPWVTVWNWREATQVHFQRKRSGRNNAVFSKDGEILFAAREDGAAGVWQLTGNVGATGRSNLAWREELSQSFAEDRLRHIDLHPNKPLMLTSGGDTALGISSRGRVQIWNIETGLPAAPAMHFGGVAEAIFSPDGGRILSVSIDGTASVNNLLETQLSIHELRDLYTVLTGSGFDDGIRRMSIALEQEAAFERLPTKHRFPSTHDLEQWELRRSISWELVRKN